MPAPFSLVEKAALLPLLPEFPPEVLPVALSLKASKVFEPDSTALTLNTMPLAQWLPWRQYAQMGLVYGD